jgi:uncharacterized RDD family membrane protein YckC
LNSFGSPYAVEREFVVVEPGQRADARAAIVWVSIAAPAGEVFDDPEFRSDRPPVVRQPRAALHDGRRQASRCRRFTAGLIDEVLVGVPSLLAHWAGAAAWTSALIHAVYYVVPTALWGWSIGKLWCGIRVVDRRHLHTPSLWQATLRWLVAALPFLLGLGALLNDDAVGLLTVLIHAPVMLDLRGVHDYAAGTVVAEKTAAGPGGWFRGTRSV